MQVIMCVRDTDACKLLCVRDTDACKYRTFIGQATFSMGATTPCNNTITTISISTDTVLNNGFRMCIVNDLRMTL